MFNVCLLIFKIGAPVNKRKAYEPKKNPPADITAKLLRRVDALEHTSKEHTIQMKALTTNLKQEIADCRARIADLKSQLDSQKPSAQQVPPQSICYVMGQPVPSQQSMMPMIISLPMSNPRF